MDPKLLVSLEIQDMDRMRQGQAPKPYNFDGFIYGHIGKREQQVDELVGAGVQCWRYFNILTYPEAGWIYQGDTWFDWQFEVLIRKWRLYMARGNEQPARFRWFNRVLLWGWPRMDEEPHIRALVDVIATFARGQGVFLDQCWRRDYAWMYHDEGPQHADFAPLVHLLWWRNVNRFLQLLINAIGVGNLLVNGDDTVGNIAALNQPPRVEAWELVPEDQCIPVYLEHAQHDWEHSMQMLSINPEQSVLSVDPLYGHHKDAAIKHWLQYGGWLAFSSRGGAPIADLAYAEADAARQQQLQANPTPPAGTTLTEVQPPLPPTVKPVRRQIPRQAAPPAPPEEG